MSFIWKILRVPIGLAFMPLEWVRSLLFGNRKNPAGKRQIASAACATRTPWKAQQPPQTYPKLDKNLETDVVIIGGGITGLTAALKLVEGKKRVVVIESREIASGTTAYSTANLYLAIEPMYHVLKQKFNQNVVNTVINSRQAAIDFIEKTINKYSIQCGFLKRPMYYFTTSEKKVNTIKEEVKAYREAGVTLTETKEVPLENYNIKAAARLENQPRFQPYQYCHALAKQIQQSGGLVFEHSPMMKMTDNKTSVTVETENYQIKAKKIIVATHSTKGRNVYNALTHPYRSYAIGIKLTDDKKHVNGNFWHLDEPFYTISTHNVQNGKSDVDLMIICGNSHVVGLPSGGCHQSHFEDAKDYAQRHYQIESIPFQWSAQHYRSADGLPYIGKSPKEKNIYIGTGYHADGLVYGTVAGILCSDLILGNNNPWASIYNPSRLTVVASSKNFIKENLKVSYGYTKGYFAPADASTFDEVKQGEGKLVRKGMKKYAAYRDDNGKLHVVSSLCPHLYGIVQFNDAEKTWDCPCHGSRFGIDGEVLEGPAMHPLKKFEW